MGVIVMPIVCITIAFGLASYLKDNLDQSITRGVLIGGTFGYVLSISALLFLA